MSSHLLLLTFREATSPCKGPDKWQTTPLPMRFLPQWWQWTKAGPSRMVTIKNRQEWKGPLGKSFLARPFRGIPTLATPSWHNFRKAKSQKCPEVMPYGGLGSPLHRSSAKSRMRLTALVDDATREEVEGVLLAVDDQGMPSVGATIEPGTKLGILPVKAQCLSVESFRCRSPTKTLGRELAAAGHFAERGACYC